MYQETKWESELATIMNYIHTVIQWVKEDIKKNKETLNTADQPGKLENLEKRLRKKNNWMDTSRDKLGILHTKGPVYGIEVLYN